MPGPEIIEGKGVVFAFVGACPRKSMIGENWKPVFAKDHAQPKTKRDRALMRNGRFPEAGSATGENSWPVLPV
jgi:hypothetical protein